MSNADLNAFLYHPRHGICMGIAILGVGALLSAPLRAAPEVKPIDAGFDSWRRAEYYETGDPADPKRFASVDWHIERRFNERGHPDYALSGGPHDRKGWLLLGRPVSVPDDEEAHIKFTFDLSRPSEKMRGDVGIYVFDPDTWAAGTVDGGKRILFTDGKGRRPYRYRWTFNASGEETLQEFRRLKQRAHDAAARFLSESYAGQEVILAVGWNNGPLTNTTATIGDLRVLEGEAELMLDRLDPHHKDMAPIIATAQAGHVRKAENMLKAHFEKRFPKSEIKIHYYGGTEKSANMALQHKFRAKGNPNYYTLHDEFDWHELPDDVDDWHWHKSFHNMTIISTLANVYLRTKDEAYAECAAQLMDDWIDGNPRAGPVSWSLATALTRIIFLSDAHKRLVHADALHDRMHTRFFNMLANHAEFMVVRRGPGNQDAANSRNLIRFAARYPEFRESSRWMETGYDRIKFEILDQVLPDGTQKELVSGYALNAIHGFSGAAREIQEIGKPVPPAYMARLEKMYDWCMIMMHPDGGMPMNGDSAPGRRNRRYLRQGADLFDRDDMRYAATMGKEGTHPGFLDAGLPIAGYYVMRTGWRSPDALYFFMDLSRQPVVSHQDYDCMKISLFAYGKEFFPDKGVFKYGGEPHREAKKTKNHTTITIDKENQGDVPATCKAFFSSDTLSYLDGQQQGYAEATHRRQVFFVKPTEGVQPYVVMVDRVFGTGEHLVDQYFHLLPARLISRDNNTLIQTDCPDDVNLAIKTFPVPGRELNRFTTLMHPHQGKRVERPTLRFRERSTLPVVFATVLIPYKGDTMPTVECSLKKTKGPAGGGRLIKISQGDITDVLISFAEPETIAKTGSKDKFIAAMLRRNHNTNNTTWVTVKEAVTGALSQPNGGIH